MFVHPNIQSEIPLFSTIAFAFRGLVLEDKTEKTNVSLQAFGVSIVSLITIDIHS